MASAREGTNETTRAAGRESLVAWAARSGRPQATGKVCGGLRFVFYGRVPAEDWQDPVTSRARQREQAGALARGHGQILAEFFDAGQSRTVAWGRRPEAARLVALLADPGRGWDAIVVGEYERAFYGSQYAAMAPLFEHYGVQLWMPEAGGRVDFASEHDEHAMTVLGLSSKREVTRTSIRCGLSLSAPRLAPQNLLTFANVRMSENSIDHEPSGAAFRHLRVYPAHLPAGRRPRCCRRRSVRPARCPYRSEVIRRCRRRSDVTRGGCSPMPGRYGRVTTTFAAETPFSWMSIACWKS